MKRLSVHIHAELEIPDDWELVDHPSGGRALRIGDKFVCFFIEPIATSSSAADATWDDTEEDLANLILDAVVEVDDDLEIDEGGELL